MSSLNTVKIAKNSFSHANMQEAAKRYKNAMLSDAKRDKFIVDYLPLVKSVVLRMKHNFPDNCQLEDMYGIGARALIVSVNQFDPSKGKSFGNYAAMRIRGALLDELRRLDYLPRSNRAKAKSLQQTILELESRNKRIPTEEEIQKAFKQELAKLESIFKHLLATNKTLGNGFFPVIDTSQFFFTFK